MVLLASSAFSVGGSRFPRRGSRHARLRSDGSPEAIDQYTLLHLVGDMVGLLDALGQETAVIAGHDWGAPVAWHAALLRPDHFRAVIGLSVPFIPRGPDYPSKSYPETDDTVFYQSDFQSPGVAEADLEHDVRLSMRAFLHDASGDAPHPAIRAEQAGQQD